MKKSSRQSKFSRVQSRAESAQRPQAPLWGVSQTLVEGHQLPQAEDVAPIIAWTCGEDGEKVEK